MLADVFPGLFSDDAIQSVDATFEGRAYNVRKTFRSNLDGSKYPVIVVTGPAPIRYACAAATARGLNLWEHGEMFYSGDGFAMWEDWQHQDVAV